MKYYTHAGKFHADEVFGYVICKLAGICESFERLTDFNNIPDDGVVADIGRIYDPIKRRFDHHQGLILRDNGVPYASAGLLWKEYGKRITEAWEIVDRELIQGIDANDADNEYYHQGFCRAGEVPIETLPRIIDMLNYEDVFHHNQRWAFESAVQLVTRILKYKIEGAEKYLENVEKFSTLATFEGDIIILKEGLPWHRIVDEKYPNAKFVIHPSNHPNNPFSLIAVQKSLNRREVKIPIERPDWFDGFIHQGKWIAGGELEDLLDLAKFNIHE